MRQAFSVLAAVAAATVTACGAPDDLPREDGIQLALSRDRIVAALATEKRLSDAPATADRLVARVRKIVASGALEAKQLDEFGLAALGELHLAVPSLVIVDRVEIPRELDREALAAFLSDAETDPSAAMKPAATAEVDRIAAILEAADAAPDAEVPVVDHTVEVYLGDLAARLSPVWPDLAARVSARRGDR
jgi:hypothetical protein